MPDEFARFVQSYLYETPDSVVETPSTNTSQETSNHVITRRHANLPIRFEDIERKYLIKQSMELLSQFIGYVEYIRNDEETRSFLEEMLKKHGDMLTKMSPEELKEYLATIQRTMEEGVNSQHQMIINGKPYSLDHIASWCCQFG